MISEIISLSMYGYGLFFSHFVVVSRIIFFMSFLISLQFPISV